MVSWMPQAPLPEARKEESAMTHDPLAPVTIRPVGRVVSDFRDYEAVHDYEAPSTIEMRADLLPALAGIEHFSHLHVAYFQHRRAGWMAWAEEEGGHDLTMPLSGSPFRKGVYTTRAPARPRPSARASSNWSRAGRPPSWSADSTPSTARRSSI
jgi:hypothetical protein